MTEIKICGLTNADDARFALELGVDYLGFVLYKGSPRGIAPDTLKQILSALPHPHRAVGVFVNETPAQVLEVAQQCRLAAVQIHGDEPAAGFKNLPVAVWRAVHGERGSAQPRPEDWAAGRYVVDAAAPGRYGGTGMTADWAFAARLARRFPVMLAGGLCPENVAKAIAVVAPLGVDVSSGVEAEPGRKDHARTRRFVEAVQKRDRAGAL